MPFIEIKKPSDLSVADIATILHAWQIEEWLDMSACDFINKFAKSEFYLLRDDVLSLLALARINTGFNVKFDGRISSFAELVGLVSLHKNHGYGRLLVSEIVADLRSRNIQSIGFCEQQLRPFYKSCGIPVLEGKAKFIKEQQADQWVASSDDDIIILNLSADKRYDLERLGEDWGGYVCEEI